MESVRARIARQREHDRAKSLEEKKQLQLSEQATRQAKFADLVKSNEFTRRLIEEIQKTKPSVEVEHLAITGPLGSLKKDSFSDSEYVRGISRRNDRYYRLARKSAGWIIKDGLLDINSAERTPKQRAYDVLLTNEGRFYKKGLHMSEDNRFYVPYGAGESTVGIFNGSGATIDDVFPVANVEYDTQAFGFFVRDSGNMFGDPNESHHKDLAHKALTYRIREYASNHTHFFKDGSSYEEIV